MRPMNTRVWRKGLRRAARGIPAGLRATHQTAATYGRGQRERDWLASWLWTAAMTEMTAALTIANQD